MTAAPKRKEELTPPWARLQRVQARKLLAVEKRTLVSVQEAVDEVTDDTIREIAKAPDRRHPELLALLLLASRRMQPKIAKRLREGRQQARVSAIHRFAAEMALAGVTIAAVHAMTPRTETDSAHASSAATAYAAAWSASAVFFLGKAERDSLSKSAAVAKATEAKASHLETIVATELPHAYSDQHREDGEALAVHYPHLFGEDGLLVDRWDAFLDACPVCWDMDGKTVPVGTSFGIGEPGYMHPRCRCMRSTVPADGSALLAA